MAWVVTAEERASFKRCRRAWDLGARTRRALVPVSPHHSGDPVDVGFVRRALAVHYFPGMWAWDRAIVRPLVAEAAGPSAPLVERYVDWARSIDDFEPLRVDSDFDARIPDPREAGRDLATPGGDAVHYRGRLDALVIDADAAHWLLVHQFGPWSDSDGLRLDEAVVVAAWAWEHQHLDIAVRGVIFNEIAPGGRFRRSVRRLSRHQVDDTGFQLGWEAMDMLDPGLAVYPTPAAHCRTCPFVTPCLAMSERGDAEGVLSSHYRPRPPDEPVEGRLGGVTWSLGRGAAPVRFGGR
ncbi:MAG: hypothetical protein H0U26_09740 [Acidimicrobiia bacterium]|nr:hypothetical protein [Acidimicrobiia bacterium]